VSAKFGGFFSFFNVFFHFPSPLHLKDGEKETTHPVVIFRFKNKPPHGTMKPCTQPLEEMM